MMLQERISVSANRSLTVAAHGMIGATTVRERYGSTE